MPYKLLSAAIRKYIRDKRWEELRPIQAAAIERIMTTDDNYILASRTASGKTEAAFLPILSKVNFNEKGIQVLYISPLIALINDQFCRIEDLCANMEVPVTKWHGEANRTLKEKIIKDPAGVILITPESLEAMFVNKPYNVVQLFANLKYVVIDEIHSFIGTDRGVQLKSLLSRLQQVNKSKYKIVGLSATIGDYTQAKQFTGDEAHTKVLLDRTAKEVAAHFLYFETGKQKELPLELLEELYKETKDNKVLIFPNNRGRAEEIAVQLKKIAARNKGHQNYFSHHSSVDREVREYVEHFAKTNTRENFCISCTSTLELGIDIGSVDEVVQIDSTNSIASLIQRVGRSGRRSDQASNLFVYATKPWSLLQALACWLLYQEGFIEPARAIEKPYDILLHQVLSIVKGRSGIMTEELTRLLQENFAFTNIETVERQNIIEHLIEIDMLEKIGKELIVGIEGEKIVNSRDFYSVFKTEENFKVVNAGNAIGEIPYSPQVIEGENILLSAHIWTIKLVDFKSKKIEVIAAKDGKKPVFFGAAGICHEKIRQKMLTIIRNNDTYSVLNEPSADALDLMRKDFSVFNLRDLILDRPLKIAENSLTLYSFTGSRINNTLNFLMSVNDIPNFADDSSSSFSIELPVQDFLEKWSNMLQLFNEIDVHIAEFLEKNPAVLDFSKWAHFLPLHFKILLLKQKYFDLAGAESFITNCRFVMNGVD
jgi:ATP-dependent Lhr-like helicase